MSHLSPDDLLGALGPDATRPVAGHLAECDRCGRRVEELRATVAAVKGVDVPEPEPVFWSAFTARVAEATSAEVPAGGAWWRRSGSGIRWGWPLAAAAVVVLAVAAGVFVKRSARVEAPDVAATVRPAIQAPLLVQEAGALNDESPWELVADASEGMDWEAVSAAGLDPAPGSADRAVTLLSDSERSELARLLKAELTGSSI
jgi:anti-sigma factor RsiW